MPQAGFISKFMAFCRAVPVGATKTRIDKKIERMYNRLRKADGRVMLYIRGNYTIQLNALVNTSKQEKDSVEDWRTGAEIKEFVFLTSELIDSKGNFIEPNDGDIIQIGTKQFYIIQLPDSAYYNYTDAGEIITIVKGTLR